MAHLITDADGVYIDSFEESWRITCDLYAHDPPTREEYKDWFKGNIFAHIEKHAPKTFVADHNPFFDAYTAALDRIPPVRDELELYREISLLTEPLSIVSSLPKSILDAFAQKRQCQDVFNRAYGHETSKSKVVKLSLALADAGITATDAVFVTDTLGDMSEASRVGIRTIAVTWGYCGADTLRKGNPFAIVNDVDSLRDVLYNTLGVARS